MHSLFAQLALADVQQDVLRNIVSLHPSQDLFDDLSPRPSDWALAQAVEDAVKPPTYQSHTPLIDRPFEDAAWFNAIEWPFKNWRHSRFSDGSFGVWYGSESVETTVYESAYHWVRGFLADAGFEREAVVAERKVYRVACAAALLDTRPAVASHPDLLHPSDYSLCQSVGARLHREGHPGLLTPSVRRPAGLNCVLFNPRVLSQLRHQCQLTYRLAAGQLVVEKQPGTPWLTLDVAHWGTA